MWTVSEPGAVDEEAIQSVLEAGDIFDFRPAAIIQGLKLTTPDTWSYRESSVGGHFGRNFFPWEQTDKAAALKDVFSKKERNVA